MRIDEAGRLVIKRNGVWKEQYCPYSLRTSTCGDWCPHFGEPELLTDNGGTRTIRVSICESTTLVCADKDFVNERVS